MKSLSQIQAELRTGSLTVSGIVSHYLDNIKKKQSLNAFIEVFAAEALKKARGIDQKKHPGKLAGLIIAIKDNICYQDHKVSAASRILENYIAPYSATVVERLLAEDAIIIGRTNCDEFAMGSSGEKSAFGKTLNPLDITRVPGGSSSGSAAAVAAGCCLAALGSDTGGSVRQPASFCGLIGLKPTYGLVSRWGLIAYASSFDQVGILAKNIEDCSRILNVIAGADSKDQTLHPQRIPGPVDSSFAPEKIKIGVIKESLDYPLLDKNIRESINHLRNKLTKKSIPIDQLSVPWLDYVVPTFHVLAPVEAMSNLARYDGIKFGTRTKNFNAIEDLWIKSRTEGFGKEVKQRILTGAYIIHKNPNHIYQKALKIRQRIQEETEKLFEQYDFILSPTTPDVAFPFGERNTSPQSMFLEDIYLMHANLTGNPAITLPIGKHPSALPFGIQIMSKKFQEKKLFAFSNYLMNTME
ncbi:MAG: Asp-tRNA(Asn)/Glu-tRNA(Gln) amidotransferase subunit GatA [Bacteroidales bacterium]|jgi:aspartyl-tRNA(Asn)/glutamyl-tRNA(Gln) amidotransferase subunit A|nr:Asp-tRNA(Asn)/Glu-tRNA(Gln) amidotransferase subunit GatA [Bacteroidales bacterium]